MYRNRYPLLRTAVAPRIGVPAVSPVLSRASRTSWRRRTRLVTLTLTLLGSAVAQPIVAEPSQVLLQANGDRQSFYSPSDSTLVLAGRDVSVQRAHLDQAVTLRVDSQTQQWLLLATRTPGSGTQPARFPARDLVVLRGDGATFQETVVPASRSPRTAPVLLTRGPFSKAGGAAELAGVAWLEGASPRHQEVWWSAWNGRFSPPERLVERGIGSQVALVGTTLRDGRAMLVWSAFDGEDTELLFLVQNADHSFGQPRRLAPDNRVPDVTPTITALPRGGALVAWSTFDQNSAQYRVTSAAFDGASFSAPRVVGPAGSVRPHFIEDADVSQPVQLLFAEAWPWAWRLVELELAHRVSSTVPLVRRSARLSQTTRRRPLVWRRGDDLHFVWARARADTGTDGQIQRAAGAVATQTVGSAARRLHQVQVELRAPGQIEEQP